MNGSPDPFSFQSGEGAIGAAGAGVMAQSLGGAPPRELFDREARLDGRLLAKIRGLEVDDGFIVECEVHPKGGSGPVSAGPYRFSGRQDAKQFVDEAILALEYLGCDVS